MLTRKQLNALAAFVAGEDREDHRVADAWALREILAAGNPAFDPLKWAKGCNVPICCKAMVTTIMGIVMCDKCKTTYYEVPKYKSGIGELHWVTGKELFGIEEDACSLPEGIKDSRAQK